MAGAMSDCHQIIIGPVILEEPLTPQYNVLMSIRSGKDSQIDRRLAIHGKLRNQSLHMPIKAPQISNKWH